MALLQQVLVCFITMCATGVIGAEKYESTFDLTSAEEQQAYHAGITEVIVSAPH